jgi:hypothetical protein
MIVENIKQQQRLTGQQIPTTQDKDDYDDNNNSRKFAKSNSTWLPHRANNE